MRVADLMTTDVVAVRPDTPLKEVAEMLVEHGISGVPVCDEDGVVLGVVSEADILMKESGRPERPGRVLGWMLAGTLTAELAKVEARTAGDAMTRPAITTTRHRSAAGAARAMIEDGINRLPVVDNHGKLVGIVSRADLVRAFARPDEEIAREIRDDVLHGSVWAEPGAVEVTVRNGEVELTGELERKSEVEVLLALTERVPGVVSVRSDVGYRVDNTSRRFAAAS